MPFTAKPLSGLKVIELGTLIAGPFASRICGEFGAEVIKIESPDGGDPLRKWRKLYEGTSLWWFVQARNKKSLTLNLKHPDGLAILKKLLGEADILIENFRPGVLEKLGLGWEVLHALNPKLVMVRLSGFGQTGPMKDQPGFGAVGESMGGLRYITGFEDRPPVRTGISIGDSIAALWGVIGALMALRHREVNGGLGQVVDVALYEAIFAMMESMVPEFDVFGFIRERTGNIMPGITPSSIHTSADGKHVQIGANGDAIFKRFMLLIGREDLANDPQLASKRWARQPSRRDLRGDRSLGQLTAAGCHHRAVESGRGTGQSDLQCRRHVQRSAIPGQGNVPQGQAAGRQGFQDAGDRAETLRDTWHIRMGRAAVGRTQCAGTGRPWLRQGTDRKAA